MYVKINGKTKKYNEILVTCTTQHGYPAIKFVGDPIPETDKGFKLYEDDGTLVKDLSEYVYAYKANIYSTQQDIIEEPSGNPDPVPESALDRLSKQVSRLGSRVSQITPFKESKTAYYGEKEKRFYGVPSGVVTVFFDKYDGEYTVSRIEDVLTVSFPALASETNITIMVQ